MDRPATQDGKPKLYLPAYNCRLVDLTPSVPRGITGVASSIPLNFCEQAPSFVYETVSRETINAKIGSLTAEFSVRKKRHVVGVFLRTET